MHPRWMNNNNMNSHSYICLCSEVQWMRSKAVDARILKSIQWNFFISALAFSIFIFISFLLRLSLFFAQSKWLKKFAVHVLGRKDDSDVCTKWHFEMQVYKRFFHHLKSNSSQSCLCPWNKLEKFLNMHS